MTIIPAAKFIILKPTIQKTLSNLDIPAGDKDMPVTGTVYKIGKGKLPMPIHIGDMVIFKKYLTNKVYIAEIGEELDFVRFEDVVAVLPKKKK